MFRDVLLNRAIFGGVTCFVLVVGAQLHRWHVRHEIAAALARRAPAIYLDVAAVFLLSETREEETAEDAPVSPFGFGLDPKVPPAYPNPWNSAEARYELSPERARNWELMERVSIELWKQGKYPERAAMENPLVYPCYPNTVYLRWDEYIDEDGTPVAYIKELLVPASMLQHANDFDNDIIPPRITVMPYEKGGIDPYTFLNVN